MNQFLKLLLLEASYQERCAQQIEAGYRPMSRDHWSRMWWEWPAAIR